MKFWVLRPDGSGAAGPYEVADLKKVPGFSADTVVAPDGAADAGAWRPAKSYDQLRDLFRKPPLPPPEAARRASPPPAAPPRSKPEQTARVAPAPAAAAPVTSPAASPLNGKTIAAIVVPILSLLAYALHPTTSSSTAPRSAARAPAVQAASASASTVPADRYGLKWDQLPDSPIRAKINGCRLVDGLDALTLYYGLAGVPYTAEEFGHYFPSYGNARDEFERQKAAPEVVEKLRAKQQELQQTPVCAKIVDIPIGDYDFEAKRFPLTHHGGGKHGILGMKSHTTVEDYSKSAEDTLREVNANARLNSSPGQWDTFSAMIEFINDKDKTLFPDYLAMGEGPAQKASREFGTLVDEQERSIAQAVGSEYHPERSIVAYALFRPTLAASEDGLMMGVNFKIKVLRGKAEAVVLATEKGTVLGAYEAAPGASATSVPPRPRRQPKTKQPPKPAQAPVQPADVPPATPTEHADATKMSLDELNQYLGRGGNR